MAIAELDYRFKPRRSIDACNQGDQPRGTELQQHVPIEGRTTHSEEKTPAPKFVKAQPAVGL